MQAVALTIAGSDPSGGAGVQADLKTFHQFGVYGEAVLTLVTVQNTRRVERVECLAPDLVAAQIHAVVKDIPPGAAKTGALGNLAIVEAVAEAAAGFAFPLVVDPVMISKHGAPLLEADAQRSLRERLLPHAALVTPNLAETEALAGMRVESVRAMQEAARRIAGSGAGGVLVKGGHLPGSEAIDGLWWNGEWFEFPSPRLETRHTHGTGCTFSAAITAELAKGVALPSAVAHAKTYTWEAIRSHPGLGRGAGPVNHFARIDPGPPR